MTSIRALVSTLVAVLCLTTPSARGAEETPEEAYAVDPALYAALEYRMIGPHRGGRVTAVTGVASDLFTFYMGTTGGGVWKSVNAGESWENVSDGFFAVGSVGAVEVAAADPNVVYAGTGSACPRGNVSSGDGIYKSTDGGATWIHAGLPEAGLIGRIRVHPKDPDLVYVAAFGHIFGPDEERGVYRSRDGGTSWQRVLYVSERTGAVDLALNPRNPRELYAAMWRAERKPWTMIDGGSEGGLYKSMDAGETWTKMAGGLPPFAAGEEALVGRIGVTVSPARGERVWAVVTARGEAGGLYRSDDAGETWEKVSADRRLFTRGWYYAHVYADPVDENTVYVLNLELLKSIDGGRTFEELPVPHGDEHDLWIHPEDPRVMVLGDDGGAAVSLDGGRNWSSQLNQPTAEFYRVTVDRQFPYRVYGAQQDNSTIGVPSRGMGGTPQQDWIEVAGGESGHVAVDPRYPELTYAGNYIGQIDRYDRRTGHSRNVILYPQLADGVPPRDLRYRFQWNAPIVLSPHDPDVVYHTSSYVHRSRDGGMSWETLSGDLTYDDVAKQELPGGPIQHDDTGVEVYSTIFAFAESPHRKGVLWAGTDDGRVHLSRDDGTSWREITPPETPEDGTVNTIEISPHAAGRALVAVYRYRLDDERPYVFRTDDYGASWTSLADGTNGIPADHPVRVVREDPGRRGLLYAGTERGLFVSFDDGASWQSLQLNLPATPVTDLAVHEGDLVVATQGRSFWILDDLTPLHQLGAEVAEAPLYLFAPRETYRVPSYRREGPRLPGAAPKGAVLSYVLVADAEGELLLEILDAAGTVIRRFSNHGEGGEDDEEELLPALAGMNRFVWDLKTAPLELAEGAVMSLGYEGGAWVPPGRYRVRLRHGEESAERPLVVKKDPRLVDVTQEDLDAQHELVTKIRRLFDETHDAVRGIRSVRDQLAAVAERAEAAGIEGPIRERAEALAETLTAIEEALLQTRNEADADPINFAPRLDNQIVYLYGHVNQGYGRPTAGAYERFNDLEAEVRPHLLRLQEVFENDLAAFDGMLEEMGAGGVLVPRPGAP